MILYRLERNDYGIFCEDYSNIAMNFPEDALYSKIGYTCDGQYRDNGDFRSACESVEQLIEYFGSDFAYALQEVASIVEYNIHKAHVRFGIDVDISIEVVFDSTKVKSRHVLLKGDS